MKLGVITTPWSLAEGLSLPETFERIAALGYRYVDISGVRHGDPLALSDAEKQAAADALRRNALVPACIALWPPGNVATPDTAERESCFAYVRAGIDFAAQLGTPNVLFNTGQRSIGLEHGRAWQNAVGFVRQAADYADEHGISVLVESEPYVYYVMNDLATSLQMVEEVDRPNCLTIIDLGHMSLSRESPTALADAADKVGHIHITDNDGLLHANDIVGTGTTPVRAYLAAIHEAGLDRDPVAVIELGVPGDRIDSPERWVEASSAHALEVAPFLTLG